MKSVIHEEFASGTFLQARAQALSTKSFTDSLYAPFESKFSCFRTLKKENHLSLKSTEKWGSDHMAPDKFLTGWKSWPSTPCFNIPDLILADFNKNMTQICTRNSLLGPPPLKYNPLL